MMSKVLEIIMLVTKIMFIVSLAYLIILLLWLSAEYYTQAIECNEALQSLQK